MSCGGATTYWRKTMNLWYVFLTVLVLIGGVAGLYGLHRLGLWLEERGWLYYKHKKPDGGTTSCFVAVQEVLEPQITHVLEIKEQKRHHSDRIAPGQAD